jgi:hypothetical protein
MIAHFCQQILLSFAERVLLPAVVGWSVLLRRLSGIPIQSLWQSGKAQKSRETTLLRSLIMCLLLTTSNLAQSGLSAR